ncbi:hypothetical protein SAY87_019801 [Trapa incisa]|uniref:UspA domain-containing protein n=1 Tax=Trapa incisa TaxID=236973 RepID=A0AAN7K8G7_9MYRT|nr:hypothetical protein SAY87_019801 [Trapa incisa]
MEENVAQGTHLETGEIRLAMETLKEDEEYKWREVKLPILNPTVTEASPGLDRETGERRWGRDVVVTIDHGPNSKHAFDWALIHLCRIADTLHLVQAVSSVKDQIIYEQSRTLMQNLAVEAFQVTMYACVRPKFSHEGMTLSS